MKKLTPMGILKSQFTQMKEFTSYSFSWFTLNEGRSHYNPRGENSKGVVNDHTLIFKQKGVKGVSFAFVFDYKGKEKDDFRIYFQTKDQYGITMSKSLTVNEVKEGLNTFIKDMNALQDDFVQIKKEHINKKLNDLFMQETINLKEEIKKLQEELDSFAVPMEKELQNKTIVLRTNRDKLKVMEKEVKKKLSDMDIKREVYTKERELIKLRRLLKKEETTEDAVNVAQKEFDDSLRKLNVKKTLLEKTEGVLDMSKKIDNIIFDIRSYRKDLEVKIEQFKAPLDNLMKRRLKRTLYYTY